MFCVNCGSEIFQGNVCARCGYDQTKQSFQELSNQRVSNNNHHKKSGGLKRVGIIAIMLICFGVGLVGFIYYRGSSDDTKQLDRLLKLIDDRNFLEAREFYDDNLKGKDDKRIKEVFPDKMQDKYDNILDEYNHGKIDSDSMDSLIYIIESIITEDEKADYFKQHYQILHMSKQNYHEAIELIRMKDYEEGISCLEKVSEEDYFYEDSKEQIKGAIVSSVEDNANYLLSENKYKEAKEYIDNMVKSYPDMDRLKQKQKSLKDDYIDLSKKQAESYYASKDYGKAASSIKVALVQIDEENPELEKLYMEYLSYNNVYIDEIETLSDGGATIVGQSLQDNTGKTYKHSFSFNNYVEYILDGKYSTFAGVIALPMSNKNTKCSHYYEIYGDEKLMYTSPTFKSGSLPAEFSCDISGVKIMKIKGYMIYKDASYNQIVGQGYINELLIYDGLLTSSVE